MVFLFNALSYIQRNWTSFDISLFQSSLFGFGSTWLFLSPNRREGWSWSWSYGSWIYNYLCNQCLSPLKLWARNSIRARCTTCDKVCQWLATGRFFSTGPPVSYTNKIDRYDMTEILLKVALNTIKQTNRHVHKSALTWSSTNKYCKFQHVHLIEHKLHLDIKFKSETHTNVH